MASASAVYVAAAQVGPGQNAIYHVLRWWQAVKASLQAFSDWSGTMATIAPFR
jgi:hypothetical protein